MKPAVAVVAAVIVVLSGGAVGAESVPDAEHHEQAEQERYGAYYAQGVRHLAEGRELQAVEALFHAYGLERSPQVMELIVEAYDQMGHCEAAERQQDYFRRTHGGDDESAPELDQCRQTGHLKVDCQQQRGVGGVVINDGIALRCGESVAVPAGEDQRVAWQDTQVVEWVQVDDETRHKLEVPEEAVQEETEVARLSELRGQVPRLPFQVDDSPEVPRLTLPSEFGEHPYRVIKTPQGLYEVWVGEEPPGAETDAEVEIVCPDDAPDGQTDEDCIWLREKLAE